MSEDIRKEIHRLLELIIVACHEVLREINIEIEKTKNAAYLKDWQKDVVKMNNILLIVGYIKNDVDTDKISQCTEFTLIYASGALRKELERIPLRKDLNDKIVDYFRAIHRMILPLLSK